MTTTDDVQAVVLQAASEIFGTEVNCTHNFFEIGGDSLTAVGLALLLAEYLDHEIDVIDLLEASDFADLSTRLALHV